MRTVMSSFLFALAAITALAQPTENHGLRVTPAPPDLRIDGDAADWDLTQTLFVCGDVTRHAETYAVRIGAAYDAQHLYLLAHWYDRTPMSNPGQVSADFGWLGDCLQLRLRTDRVTHVTAWRGVAGGDVVDLTYDRDFKGGNIKNAKSAGVQQAFGALAEGSGYVQELAFPWALITADKQPLRTGDVLGIGVEANFTLANGNRLTVKGNFAPDIEPDRIFTYTKPQVWGPATLLPEAPTEPQSVRLTDGRIFPTRMEERGPVIDWTGLAVADSAKPEGVKTLTFDVPANGYLSTIIKNADGRVVRHLLNSQPSIAGSQTVAWDGLSTPSYDKKGTPVPVGDYTVHSLWHPQYNIRFRGWAGSSAQVPWENGPTTNWGGDHGSPTAVAAGKHGVFLGWFKSESGRALVATDFDGAVIWRKKFGGMSGVKALATSGDTLFVLGGAARGLAAKGGSVYKIEQATGLYREWTGSNDAELKISQNPPSPAAQTADGIAATTDRFFLSFSKANKVVAYDAESGQQLASYEIPAPTSLTIDAAGTLYVLSGGAITMDPEGYSGIHDPAIQGNDAFYMLDPANRSFRRVAGLTNACGIAVDQQGAIYIGGRDPLNQVHVYNKQGELLRAIGREGGRALTGPWNPDGMRFISSLAVDPNGQLWVAEADNHPRRFSRWNAATGAFTKEFFGPTHYGATGAAVNPLEPNKLIGMSAEWEIDPETQTFKCLGVITRESTANSIYVHASNGRLYLVTATDWRSGAVDIFERIGDGQFVKRAAFRYEGKRAFGPGRKVEESVPKRTHYWADRNGDGQEQPDELTTVDRIIHFNPWSLHVWPDFAIYAGNEAYPLQGFTACGAPIFDVANPDIMPAAGVGSLNSDVMLTYSRKDWGASHSWYTAYDRKTGNELWRYPNNFVGVHGSHKAPPFPQPGLIRGSYGPLNCIALPEPIGNVWFFTTNLGEWHVLTEEGFYLSCLFNGDYLNWTWPDKPVLGANMNGAPSGGGGEDFGGYVTVGQDGKVYAQSGHTAYWNLEITGWNQTKRLPVQKTSISKDNFAKAASLAAKMEEKKSKKKEYKLKKHTPGVYYANLNADFKDQKRVWFHRKRSAAVYVAASYDEEHLHVGWQVTDETPWVNGAEEAQYMYARGDTVDLQIHGPKLNGKETYQRVSIGNLNGSPTAVLYREKSATKKPMSFSSGVITDFPVDYVSVEPAVQIQTKIRDQAYWVQAAIPWKVLGISPTPGADYAVDFGVTHGDKNGTDTVLRTHWNNTNTGLVNDEVFELKLEPRNWGTLRVE